MYYKLFFCSVASHPTLLKREIERGKHFEDNCVMLPKKGKKEEEGLLANNILVSFVVDPRFSEIVILQRFVQSTVQVFLSCLHRSISPTSHPWCFSTDV